MAIWGRLSDFSLHAVLSSVGKYRSGVIHVDLGEGSQYHLHVSEGVLTALLINADGIGDPELAKAVVARLCLSAGGTFRYLRMDATPLRRDFHLGLNELGNISSRQEAPSQKPLLSVFHHRGMKRLLPHADICFRLNRNDYAMDNYVLQRFLDRSVQQLIVGVSASALAELLNDDVEKIRFYFSRLIEMAVIIQVNCAETKACSE